MGYIRISDAAARGDIGGVQQFLKMGEELNTTATTYPPPLHTACEHAKLQMVRFLLSSGADVNLLWQKLHPLHYAVLGGNEELVNLLIENGADVNIQNRDGESPYHWAVLYHKPAIAQVFIKKGANTHGLVPRLLAIGDLRNEAQKAIGVFQTAMSQRTLESKDIRYHKRCPKILQRLAESPDMPELTFVIHDNPAGRGTRRPTVSRPLVFLSDGNQFCSLYPSGKLIEVSLAFQTTGYDIYLLERAVVEFCKDLFQRGECLRYIWDSVEYEYHMDMRQARLLSRTRFSLKRMKRVVRFLRPGIMDTGLIPSQDCSHAYGPGLVLRSVDSYIDLIVKDDQGDRYEIMVLDSEHHYDPYERHPNIALADLPTRIRQLALKYNILAKED